MLSQQENGVKRVLHSTDEVEPARIDPLQISPVESDSRSWPSVPLVEWPLETVEMFFETLGVLVRHEGAVQ